MEDATICPRFWRNGQILEKMGKNQETRAKNTQIPEKMGKNQETMGENQCWLYLRLFRRFAQFLGVKVGAFGVNALNHGFVVNHFDGEVDGLAPHRDGVVH